MKKETPSQKKFNTGEGLKGLHCCRVTDVVDLKAKRAAENKAAEAKSEARASGIETTDIGH